MRIRWCIVGLAVYHVALHEVKVVQKVGDRRGGRMIVPPESKVERKDATMPWM